MARSTQKATKLYVGKTFSVKRVKAIDIYKGGHKGNHAGLGFASGEDLGHVLVLNEKGKGVEVWTPLNGGMAVWMAKYYLHAEIKEEIPGNPVGELSKVVAEMGELSTRLRNTHLCWDQGVLTVDYKEELELSSLKLNKLIRRLRLVQESLESESDSA